MNKTIKETFIENMIMNQHGEKIKQVQELMIEKLQNAKQSIERSIVRVVANSNDTEALNEYKLRLKAVEELLRKARYNFLDLSLDTIFIEIGWDNKKEYDELLDTLKQSSKCDSCVHTHEENNVDKVNEVLNKVWNEAFKEVTLKSEEVVLNSEAAEKILKNVAKIGEAEELGKTISDAVRIFINITNPDTSKDNLAGIAKQITEKLKKNNGSWY